jgi:hypothetical protein
MIAYTSVVPSPWEVCWLCMVKKDAAICASLYTLQCLVHVAAWLLLMRLPKAAAVYCMEGLVTLWPLIMHDACCRM